MKRFAVVALVAACALAGCSHPGTPTATSPGPSAAAKLACSGDAVSDVSAGLGVGVTTPVAPIWADGVYSCRLIFTTGAIVLSVHDLPDTTAASAAFTSGEPSDAVAVPGLGQQAYARVDGSAVVRKDASILTVDVSGLPAAFGVPLHPRNINAITVADAILACWTEDQ